MKNNMQVFIPLIIACFIISCSGSSDSRESSGDKHEWSILQNAEYKWRSEPISSPEFHSLEGYELMSVPSLSGSKRIWIMLRAESSPFYKQMPQGNYIISETVINELSSSGKISPTVEEVLRSHLIE